MMLKLPDRPAGLRGTPSRDVPPEDELYRQADRDIQEHRWEHFEAYEFTEGQFLPQRLSTWIPNNQSTVNDFYWYPQDLDPDD